MNSKKLVDIIKEKLNKENFTFRFDKEKDTLRIEFAELNRGITITLPEIIAKYNTLKEKAIEDVVYTITETYHAMKKEVEEGFRDVSQIYPVIRSTSFPLKTKAGVNFVTTDHTAETRIFYALDLGNTYRLIDEEMLPQLNLSSNQIREAARFSVRKLSTNPKRDEVGGNIFYFINENDGYDASRILNESFLKEMKEKIEGEMTVSVPHQDVLIIGDIRNEAGYDILAQMTMHFFTVGAVPITSLSFLYENDELEPIFIMAKSRVKKNKDN